MSYYTHDNAASPDFWPADTTLFDSYYPLTTSTDPDTNTTFVSSIEGTEFPMFGTHFHPEQVLSDFSKDDINHSWNSINGNRYFADRFVTLARFNNSNHCDDECQKLLIENYPLITGTDFGNIFVF